MKIHLFPFDTEAEADAFVRGVNAFKPEDVTDICIGQKPTGEPYKVTWLVAVHDHRPDAPDDRCPICNFSASDDFDAALAAEKE